MKEQVKVVKKNVNEGAGAVYGLGLVGSLFYFLSHSNSFWEGMLGILKSLVWPAVLVFSLLDFLRL
jgi:hypothetical protein